MTSSPQREISLENRESMGDPDDYRDQGNCEIRQHPCTAHLAIIARGRHILLIVRQRKPSLVLDVMAEHEDRKNQRGRH